MLVPEHSPQSFYLFISSYYVSNLLFGSLCFFILDYAVKEKPLLDEDMKGGPDYIVLKTLDTDGVRIIGSVLGQSIALDYFVSQVISYIFCDVFSGALLHWVACFLAFKPLLVHYRFSKLEPFYISIQDVD